MPTIVIDGRDAFAPDRRGWGRYARELIDALPERDGIAYHVMRRAGRGPELLFEQVGLPVRLARLSADVVHAPNCFLPLARPCPGVVTIHDLAFEVYPGDFSRQTGWKYRTFTPRAARSAQRVICVSQFTADDVVRRYGVNEDRVRVIGEAPSLAVGDARPPTDGGPYLLAVGDLRPKKNLLRLLQAFRALRAEGREHRLVLAGVDSGEGERVRAASGGEPVELTGYVSDERLDALMRGADALVYPSLYEGFGLVLVEAMARGVPVLAARATALPETAGDAAEYFDPLDVTEMTAAIRRVLDDRGRREELVRRGYERVGGLSWTQTAAQTAAVYEELL